MRVHVQGSAGSLCPAGLFFCNIYLVCTVNFDGICAIYLDVQVYIIQPTVATSSTVIFYIRMRAVHMGGGSSCQLAKLQYCESVRVPSNNNNNNPK